MSTRGDLRITKNLIGDCAANNEIAPGDQIVWELVVDNTSAEDREVTLYDAIDPFTMAEFSWAGFDTSSGATTGSAGGGVDAIDETITLAPCARFVYTITVTTKEPYCGVVVNSARYCTPDEKFPSTVHSEPVYVGMVASEARLDHEGTNMNETFWELMPKGGRAKSLMALAEGGWDILHLFEGFGKLLADNENIKLWNENYEGFIEAQEAREAEEARRQAAEERQQEAIDAANASAEAGDDASGLE